MAGYLPLQNFFQEILYPYTGIYISYIHIIPIKISLKKKRGRDREDFRTQYEKVDECFRGSFFFRHVFWIHFFLFNLNSMTWCGATFAFPAHRHARPRAQTVRAQDIVMEQQALA